MNRPGPADLTFFDALYISKTIGHKKLLFTPSVDASYKFVVSILKKHSLKYFRSHGVLFLFFANFGVFFAHKLFNLAYKKAKIT